LKRLAVILARHPHICLSCPDRDGCARDECTYGNPVETRCCDEFARCELGRLVSHVDADATLRRRAVGAARAAVMEGRIRREPGLCVGCGRCVEACETSPEAGRALELVPVAGDDTAAEGSGETAGEQWEARPKRATLRESGCTFCGLCVMVCPAGALTTPGQAGARWLSDRRVKHRPAALVLPPESRRMVIPADVETVPCAPGLFTLLDRTGQVLRICGVADLRVGLAEALAEPASAAAIYFQIELDPLYTQRETELLARYARDHGHLPFGNDLGEELFGDD
jgi:ferredoxin